MGALSREAACKLLENELRARGVRVVKVGFKKTGGGSVNLRLEHERDLDAQIAPEHLTEAATVERVAAGLADAVS